MISRIIDKMASRIIINRNNRKIIRSKEDKMVLKIIGKMLNSIMRKIQMNKDNIMISIIIDKMLNKIIIRDTRMMVINNEDSMVNRTISKMPKIITKEVENGVEHSEEEAIKINKIKYTTITNYNLTYS